VSNAVPAVSREVTVAFNFISERTVVKDSLSAGDRTGCLSVLLKEERCRDVERIKLMLTLIARAMCLCPSRQGAEIVIRTLQNPALTKKW
jgi:aspartate/tyrosine/aromatic aminotransferase